MRGKVAAVTMVREDAFFLRLWLRHYGRALGRENCYVVNHGRGAQVAALARGCNVIGIPGAPHPNFDMKRWRLLNHLVAGLRTTYDHVVVGDVDELVVVDPATGQGLGDWLGAQKTGRVLTPLGLEVIHRPDLEAAPIGETVLGPRRFLRPAPHYAKPCVISTATKIARGGHYAQHPRLDAPEPLYLFHLKYCDAGEYAAAMDRRNAMTAALGVGVKEAAVGRHWFAEARPPDDAVFAAFAARRPAPWAPEALRAAMRSSFRPRGDTGFWHFDRPESDEIWQVPERFVGLV